MPPCPRLLPALLLLAACRPDKGDSVHTTGTATPNTGLTETATDSAPLDETGAPAQRLRGVYPLADADAVFYGEAEADEAGRCLAAVGDLDGDGYHELAVGSRGSDHNGADSGAVYLLCPPLNGVLGAQDACAVVLGSAEGDRLGPVAAAGDGDGDGLGDLLLGSRGHGEGGAAWWFPGPLTGWLSTADAPAGLLGADGAYTGVAVAGAGDVDGDGLDDLLVGASKASEGGMDAGAAYLLLAPFSGLTAAADADARLQGTEAATYAGAAVAAGDVDGDGHADLLLASSLADDTGTDSGAAWLFKGPVTGMHGVSAADATFRAGGAGAYLGVDLSLGDVDGDGNADVLLGAFGADDQGTDAGAAWLFSGPMSGTLAPEQASAGFLGDTAGGYAGYAVENTGDVDGDGFCDVLMGAFYDQGQAGAVYLFYGPTSGVRRAAEADATFLGTTAGDYAGVALAAVPEDMDGQAHIWIGAHGQDSGGNTAGAAYLVRGAGR